MNPCTWNKGIRGVTSGARRMNPGFFESREWQWTPNPGLPTGWPVDIDYWLPSWILGHGELHARDAKVRPLRQHAKRDQQPTHNGIDTDHHSQYNMIDIDYWLPSWILGHGELHAWDARVPFGSQAKDRFLLNTPPSNLRALVSVASCRCKLIQAGSRRMLYLACFFTVFLLSGPGFFGCLGKSPGERLVLTRPF